MARSTKTLTPEQEHTLLAQARTAGVASPSSICRRCHRLLKNPIFVAIGMGRICLMRTLRDTARDERPTPGRGPVPPLATPDTPWAEDFMITRVGEQVVSNVPWRLCYHSPDGFNFGYGGSGPADYAWNLLSVLVGSDTAERLYQEFKFAFVSPLNEKNGGTIKLADVVAWLAQRHIICVRTEQGAVTGYHDVREEVNH